MIPGLNFLFHFVSEEVKLTDLKPFGRNRRAKIGKREVTKFKTKDFSQGIGQTLIAPRRNINGEFEVIRLLTRNGMKNVQTKQTVF